MLKLFRLKPGKNPARTDLHGRWPAKATREAFWPTYQIRYLGLDQQQEGSTQAGRFISILFGPSGFISFLFFCTFARSGYLNATWLDLLGCIFEVWPAPGAREGSQKGGGLRRGFAPTF